MQLQRSITNHRSRNLKTTARSAAMLLAALPAALLAWGGSPARAVAPIYPAPYTAATPQPWSWPQIKQSYGTVSTVNNAFVLSDPGVPTVTAGTATSLDFLSLEGLTPAAIAPLLALDNGTELRSYILGDYTPTGVTTNAEPPNGANYFFDATGGSQLNSSLVGGWVSPLFSISNLRNNNVPVATQDDQGNLVTTGGFAQITPAPGAINNEYYRDAAGAGGGDTATWTIVAPTPGTYEIWANIPSVTGETRITDATYTITGGTIPVTATADQTRSGYIRVGGVVTTAVNQTITVQLHNSTANVGAGLVVDADAIQLRQTNDQLIDNIDPPAAVTTQPFFLSGFNAATVWNASTADLNFYGSDYLFAHTVARSNNTSNYSFANWQFAVGVTGTYSIYFQVPSQNGTTTGGVFTPDYHVGDAQYKISIFGPGNASAIPDYFTFVHADQKNGGFFVKLDGPFSIPAGSRLLVQLDNSSNTLIEGGQQTEVVADAMQLKPDNGYVVGTPVAVNVTDYPELRYGYGNQITPTNATTGPPTAKLTGPAPVGFGGYPLFYTTSKLFTATTTITNPNPPPPQITIPSAGISGGTPEYHGLALANYPVTNNNSVNPGFAQNTSSTPISQVVYFGRTEVLQFNGANTTQGFTSPGPATQSGAVYAVDGLNGNIIWKYGTTNLTVDDTDTASGNFTFSGFGADQNGPGTGYYGSGYRTAGAVYRNSSGVGTPTATAQWNLPIATNSGAASYYVYVRYPVPGTGETYTQVNYTVNSADPVNPTVTVKVDQTANGGQWVPLTNPNTANGSFILNGANHSVTLTNLLDYVATPPSPVPSVVADAVMFVPVGGTGTISSSPTVVRQMKVLTVKSDGTHQYEPRDVVIFSDNLGKLYCVDAAGNQDGDDTILDAAGNPVSFDSSGNPFDPATGLPFSTPYDFHLRNYGTTTLYWIWQPDSSPAGVILHSASVGSGDSVEATPDSARDLPAPGPYLMNSPTLKLTATTATSGAPCYAATLFIGNSNGVLYSLDAQGVLPYNKVTNPGDPNQYRLTRDPTVPTLDVNWWFNTGQSIAYAPAYNPIGLGTGADRVYVTTYDPLGNNRGRLYAVNATLGPVGNAGKGPLTVNASGANSPQTYNYNQNQIPYWSFPDAYGTVSGLAAKYHVNDSAVNGGKLPAATLGDMAGAPTVETLTNTDAPHILICANDPSAPSFPGNPTNGRVYSINADGTMNWAFPSTFGGGPNAVGLTDTAAYNTVFNNSSQTTFISAFTEAISDLNVYASSSVVTGVITFPFAQPANLSALEDQRVPMAYVGTLDGHMLGLDLNGIGGVNTDAGRMVFYQPVTQDAIYSTPALLPGSALSQNAAATATPADNSSQGIPATSNEVGGVLFVNTAGGTLVEMEATPYVFSGATLVNIDWEYNGPGGVSSPSVAAFDVATFNDQGLTTVAKGDVEFVYSGSDDGFCWAFTPNTSSGGGFTPSDYIPPDAFPPPGGQVNLSRNIVTRISGGATPATNADYLKSIGPPDNPVYDWGQTFWLQFYGVDNGDHSVLPHAQSISYTLTTLGSGGKALRSNRVTRTLDTTNVFLAANFPPAGFNAAELPTGPAYVANIPVVVDSGPDYTPGAKVTISNIQYDMIDENGLLQHIQGTVDTGRRIRVPTTTNGTTTYANQLSTPVDQATFGILNPIAVTGGARTIDGNPASFVTIGELGPLQGIPDNTKTGFATWKYAAANGNYVPTSPPVGGTFGGGATPDPTSLTQMTVATEQTVFVPVAVGLGEVSHGTAGDSGLPVSGDAPASSSGAPNNHPAGSTVYQSPTTTDYGQSLLLVTDRSAMGSNGRRLDQVYLDNRQVNVSWNDNTGQGGPGSVINMINWDTPPLAYNYGTTNSSRDYPDIPGSDLSGSLTPRTQSGGGINHDQFGSSAQINASPGTLAPSDAAGGQGDPTGTRTVYPMSTVVKVAVPQFQPANLEVYRPSSQTPEPHTSVALTDVPQGYVATARVYYDSNHNGHFDPNEPYRTVQIYVGVPVDMGMAIDEPTVDVGTVPAGFGDQVLGAPWTPITLKAGNTKRDPESALESYYSQFYHSGEITIRNNGNVNLVNVHLNQQIAGPDVANSRIAPYLQLISDQNEKPFPYNPFSPLTWTDSLSFIPSVDSSGYGASAGLLMNSPGGQTGYIVRSSLDTDVYTPNVNETDLANNAPNARAIFNPSLHKARPGDTQGTVLSVPDEPHDQANPAYQYANPLPFPYQGSPVVSVAVPVGTPVGTYFSTVRAFEGSDPYDDLAGNGIEPANSGYSGIYTGPTYTNALPGGANTAGNTTGNAQNDAALSISGGAPAQYYSQPGTVMKVTVSESRFTDGPSLVSNGNVVALPNAETAPAVSGTATNGVTKMVGTDIQPYGFGVAGAKGLSDLGLMFISNRSAVTAANPQPITFDLFTSSMAAATAGGSALSVPSGTGQATWWTTPQNQSTPTGTPGAIVSSPFVLSDGTSPLTAFWVNAPLNAYGQPASYQVDFAPVTVGATGMTLGAVTTAYTSQTPVYNVHAAHFQGQDIILWDTHVRGRASIEYLVLVAGATPRQLPVSPMLVDVSHASPVLRFITNVNGGALANDPDTTQHNGLVTPDNDNFLDVTYSGVSQTGSTDVYVSRYLLKNEGTAASPRYALVRQAIAPQNQGGVVTTMTERLIRSATDTSLYYGQDLDWAVDPSVINVSYVYSSSPNPPAVQEVTVPIIDATQKMPYLYDHASGQIIYPKVTWKDPSGNNITGNVYVNPALGTVRLSVPLSDPTATVVVTVVPLSQRVTYNARVNTQPVAMLDDYLKATTPSTTYPTGNLVHSSREWFVYRKSGSSTGDTSAVNATLYYDTRRLTVDLSALDTANQTKSIHMVANTTVSLPATLMDGQGFKVEVSNSPNMAGAVDVTNRVDVDVARARVYFPSYMEGLYARVTYHNQNYGGLKDNTGNPLPAGQQPPGYNANLVVTGVQLQWQDEPYVNAQNPTKIFSGERTVPITTAINESEPSAFVDPGSGLQTVNGTSRIAPHRVWLFWSSTRNAAATGSDIYFETLDPKFSPDLP